jgi:enoyl-CoA hydratase/carnithine racemase
MQFSYLKTDRLAEGILHVSMQKPPANAVNVAMYDEIRELFSSIREPDNETKVVVFGGEGRFFCAGNDLEEFRTMDPTNARERMWHVREAFSAIAECAVPVIGMVHGVALGTGLALAASCDFVVAADNAKFGLPELSVGVMGGARHLARIAPQPLVRRMYFTGEQLTAEQFAGLGGAITVVSEGQLLDEATRLAKRIASFSPTAVRVSKTILDRIEWMDLAAGYRHEQRGTEIMSGHPDSKEALRAFDEKRAARFAPLERDERWYVR